MYPIKNLIFTKYLLDGQFKPVLNLVFDFLCSIFCKMPLTGDEAVDLIAVFFECFQNATIAERQYAIRYPDRRHYGRKIFQRLVQRLRDTGSFSLPKFRKCRSTGRTEENIINM